MSPEASPLGRAKSLIYSKNLLYVLKKNKLALIFGQGSIPTDYHFSPHLSTIVDI